MSRHSGLERLAQRSDSRKLYHDYLRRIDVELVLDFYGAQNRYQRGDDIIHSCLIDQVDPHHNNGDQTPSASANVEKKVYNCYSFGGGDIFWLIAKMEGVEQFHEIVHKLGPFLSGSTETAEDFLDELEKYFASPDVPQPAPIYHERVLSQWAVYHPYLRDRGVTKEAAKELQLGYDERTTRITIPHWHDGKLVGWQKRSLSDPRWPQTPVNEAGKINKYESSSGFPKHSTLYNLDRVLRRGLRSVVVVESPMSVAKAESLGVDNVLCTFGAKVTGEQVELMRQFDEVTVWFDSDPAGRKGSYQIMDRLYRHTSVMHVEPELNKDLGDCESSAEITRMMDNKEPAVLALLPLEETYGSQRRR